MLLFVLLSGCMTSTVLVQTTITQPLHVGYTGYVLMGDWGEGPISTEDGLNDLPWEMVMTFNQDLSLVPEKAFDDEVPTYAQHIYLPLKEGEETTLGEWTFLARWTIYQDEGAWTGGFLCGFDPVYAIDVMAANDEVTCECNYQVTSDYRDPTRFGIGLEPIPTWTVPNDLGEVHHQD